MAQFPQAWLVRHGETAWSLSGQHTGRSDIPLTARGEQEARDLNARLGNHTFALVLSSPSSRALQTCELAGFGGSVQLDDDLMEWDYGRYEGRRTAEIRAENPGWSAFTHGSPEGEDLAEVAARAVRVISRTRSARGDVLLFAHRDILRVISALWVSLPALEARRLYLEPASVSVLSYDHSLDEPIIRRLNT